MYISIDKNSRDSIWRQTIQRYKLYGSHIRTSKKLQENIEMVVWGAKDAYSIPHYLIFDKYGTVVDKNAPGPGQGTAIYEELKKRLDVK